MGPVLSSWSRDGRAGVVEGMVSVTAGVLGAGATAGLAAGGMGAGLTGTSSRKRLSEKEEAKEELGKQNQAETLAHGFYHITADKATAKRRRQGVRLRTLHDDIFDSVRSDSDYFPFVVFPLASVPTRATFSFPSSLSDSRCPPFYWTSSTRTGASRRSRTLDANPSLLSTFRKGSGAWETFNSDLVPYPSAKDISHHIRIERRAIR